MVIAYRSDLQFARWRQTIPPRRGLVIRRNSKCPQAAMRAAHDDTRRRAEAIGPQGGRHNGFRRTHADGTRRLTHCLVLVNLEAD